MISQESSLAASIFGSAENINNLNPLDDVFNASSKLPQKPKNLNFTEPVAERIKRERKEEKKSKRKKKTTENEKSDSKCIEKVDDSIDETMTGDENRTIFVGNLPQDVTRKTLASMFKNCGKVKSTRLRSIATAGVKVSKQYSGNQKLVKKVCVNTNKLLETPKKSCQGYVVFEHVDSVEKALKLNNKPIPNSEELLFRVDKAKPSIDSTRSIFIGNLPYEAEEMSLRKHFITGCAFEPDVIENVRIVRDSETMQCKGFGYLLLKDKTYVPYALELHDSEYRKRTIRVMVCGKRYKDKKGGKAKDEFQHPAKRRRENVAQNAQSTRDGGKLKKKRGRKNKSIPLKAGKVGISKRVSSERKAGKRVKQIQKRLTKGMGKNKK